MKGTQERRAGRRLRIDESAPSSRIKRRREKEEQKRKYVPSRLLVFLFLALPAVVLAIHHVQSKSDTVTVVRHEDQSGRETVRIIQDDEVKRTEQAAKSKQKSAADRGSVGGREKKTDDEQGKSSPMSSQPMRRSTASP